MGNNRIGMEEPEGSMTAEAMADKLAEKEPHNNPSGMWCRDCRACGFWHCAHPEECGGMIPLADALAAVHIKDSRVSQERVDYICKYPVAHGSEIISLALDLRDAQSALADTQAKLAVVVKQLIRANKIIGWMMPYIGNMCPPSNGLFDLNEHCCDNNAPDMGEEVKGPPLKQRAFLATMEKPDAKAK